MYLTSVKNHRARGNMCDQQHHKRSQRKSCSYRSDKFSHSSHMTMFNHLNICKKKKRSLLSGQLFISSLAEKKKKRPSFKTNWKVIYFKYNDTRVSSAWHKQFCSKEISTRSFRNSRIITLIRCYWKNNI